MDSFPCAARDATPIKLEPFRILLQAKTCGWLLAVQAHAGGRPHASSETISLSGLRVTGPN